MNYYLGFLPSTIYYWRVSAEGDCGGSQSLVRTFTTIVVDDVSELSNTQISIQPNPTNGILNITLSAPLPGDLLLEVYSLDGKQLFTHINNGETNITLNLGDLASGLYLLRLVNDTNVLSKKIVVQR